jgi:hypothetical protein
MSKKIVEESIEIKASAHLVWQFFSDLTQWPKWNAGVTQAAWVSGEPWTKGAIFEFITFSGKRKSKISPTILQCNPDQTVTWLGKTITIKGRHTFRFEKAGINKTQVTTSEEFSGFLLPLLSRFISEKDIHETFSKSLANLKTQVETSKPSKST